MSVARCAVLFCACCLRMRLAFCGMTEHLFAVALCMVQVFVFRFGLRYCELFYVLFVHWVFLGSLFSSL